MINKGKEGRISCILKGHQKRETFKRVVQQVIENLQ